MANAPATPTLLPVRLDLACCDAAHSPVSNSHIEIAFGQAIERLHGVANRGVLRLVLQCLAP